MPDFRHILCFPVQKFKTIYSFGSPLSNRNRMWSGVPCQRHVTARAGGTRRDSEGGDLVPKQGFRSLG